MRLWIATLILSFGSLVHAAKSDLYKECFDKDKGRSCVQLGTQLWQRPALRQEALRAFERGCELKVESACTLKDMKHEARPERIAPAPKPAGPPPPTAKTVKPVGKSKFEVKRSDAHRYTLNLSDTLSQARMEPYSGTTKNGAIEGYQFATVDKGSIFEKLGFVEDDIVYEVNGRQITSPAVATALLATMAYEDTYVVRLHRDGKSLTHTYKLVE